MPFKMAGGRSVNNAFPYSILKTQCFTLSPAQGRNEAGKVGLFPESYTTAQPPQNSQQVPQNHLKPHSIASKLSEESSQGAASVKTGGFMSTNLSTALQDPTQSRLSSSVPATAHLNQHSDDDNARERKFSDATVESLDKGQSPIQPLSKSMNWADRAAARSELAARAKAQIEKAAQEKLARQQQQKQMYENLFSANSSVGLPHEGLEFSDESDEEQQFGARLVSAHSREASKSGAELPRASTPTNLDNPTYAHFSENSYPSNSSTMPGGLQDSPIDARGARAPPQDDNSTQQLPQLAPDDQSRELGFSNTPEPSAPPQEDIPDPSSTPIIRHEPSDSSELDADNRNSTGYTQSNSHNREHEATETLGSQPNTDMLRPDVTSCSASYMSDFSDNSTTHGMAAQFPDPPAESASTEESATHLNPPATETTPAARSSPNHLSPDLPQDLTFSAPARYQSPTLSAEQPTPLMSSDITPQPSQQSLAAKPETPVTDYNRSRPTSASQLEESSHHQSTSVRTEDTSPRSSLASKTAAPTDPRTWTVEQVVEWGRSKGFDATTLDKFTGRSPCIS